VALIYHCYRDYALIIRHNFVGEAASGGENGNSEKAQKGQASGKGNAEGN
jgi:hypothetical protein